MPLRYTKDVEPSISPQPAVIALRVVGGKHLYLLSVLVERRGLVFIGRAPGCGIRLRDPSVSAIHAILEHDSGDYILHDHDSTNGTWLDDVRVEKPAVLRVGSRILVGETAIIAVDRNGMLPLFGYTISDYCREAVRSYGSNSAAARFIGKSREFIRRMTASARRRR